MTRTVTPSIGWPYKYRAHVYEYKGWFRKGWKFAIEEYWVHWNHHHTSYKVYPTKEEAQQAADQWLDFKEARIEKDYV